MDGDAIKLTRPAELTGAQCISINCFYFSATLLLTTALAFADLLYGSVLFVCSLFGML